MFRDITILVAESERAIERVISDALTALSFRVITANSVSSCMDSITDKDPDILILDEDLINGTSQIILDYWISRCHGPVLVFAPVDEDRRGSHPLLGKGVWNVLILHKDAEGTTDITDIQALNTTLLRYAQIVEVWRVCELQKEVIRRYKKMHLTLWTTTIVLSISLAAYAGPSVLQAILSLFGGG